MALCVLRSRDPVPPSRHFHSSRHVPHPPRHSREGGNPPIPHPPTYSLGHTSPRKVTLGAFAGWFVEGASRFPPSRE